MAFGNHRDLALSLKLNSRLQKTITMITLGVELKIHCTKTVLSLFW